MAPELLVNESEFEIVPPLLFIVPVFVMLPELVKLAELLFIIPPELLLMEPALTIELAGLFVMLPELSMFPVAVFVIVPPALLLSIAFTLFVKEPELVMLPALIVTLPEFENVPVLMMFPVFSVTLPEIVSELVMFNVVPELSCNISPESIVKVEIVQVFVPESQDPPFDSQKD